ncbi:MAG: C_GCAxxG_C_C family protein [Ruminococcaceae bacterium]|nr:C_GCAxxG_C_C family protein [Oscillospiraceae bacterium]
MTEQERISIRSQNAKSYFEQGYNCSQSVALAFGDLMPVDQENLLMLASPFGGGMGRMREVCGAVSGMFLVEGYLCGYSSASDNAKKIQLYSNVRELASSFSNQNGSIICRDLLIGTPHTSGGIPEERSPEYYKKRPCAELVASAAEILAKHLLEQGIEGV